MESEILHTLQEIRGTLYLVCGIFLVGFVVLAFNSITASRDIKNTLRDDWRDKANELYTSGEFDRLIQECEIRAKSHPFDPNAYWWQARVFLEKGDLNKSNELFLKVLEVDPGWEEYVKPHQSKIDIKKNSL